MSEFTLPPPICDQHTLGCLVCGAPITLSIIGGGGSQDAAPSPPADDLCARLKVAWERSDYPEDAEAIREAAARIAALEADLRDANDEIRRYAKNAEDLRCTCAAPAYLHDVACPLYKPADGLCAQLIANAEFLKNRDDIATVTAYQLRKAAARIASLEDERDTFYMDYCMKCDAGQKAAEAERDKLREELRVQSGMRMVEATRATKAEANEARTLAANIVAKADLHDAEARCAELERDAARWSHVRSRRGMFGWMVGKEKETHIAISVGGYPNELDDLVDADMAKEK